MTKAVDGIVFIEATPEDTCDMCGKTAELRPYGPPETPNVCFECGMKDEEGTRKRFEQRFGL